MTDGSWDVSRRGFLQAAAGGGAAAGVTGVAAAQSGNGTATPGGNGTDGNGTDGNGTDGGGLPAAPQPDYGGWFGNVDNFDGTEDLRGEEEVRVMVGAEGNGGFFAFEPAAIHVSPGTTVVWEWTGEGGSHNVIQQGGSDLESELVGQEGHTYSYTFESDGMWQYYCNPHEGQGMKGAVIVGTDYPAVDTGGGGPQPLPDSAKTLGIATTFVMIATLGLAYFFLKYGGDYGDVGQ